MRRRATPRDECPALGCSHLIPSSFFACPRHWSMLPADFKREVWAAYNARDRDATLELYGRAIHVWAGR